MTEKIVVLDALAPRTAERLRGMLPPGFEMTHATERTESHLCEILADADYAVSGQVAVNEAMLRAARKLKLLHKWGVGVDNFDLDAARALGIKVARTTGSNAVPVAEFALGLMLSALRNMAYGHEGLQKGEWRTWKMRDAFMLSGKTVGIVGFGAIGKTLARLLSGFGCRILYTKPTRLDAAEEARLGATWAPLADLLAQSDVVSLHCPMTDQTRNMIDRRALSTMKKTAILVNCARGGVVVEDDLVWALREGVIHAAASDVYETEPLPPDSTLIGIPNMVTTPHLAAMAADNFEPSVRRIFENIRRLSVGEPIVAGDVVVP
jgi:phosphoglycerate dehydrogenase-like enzyme